MMRPRSWLSRSILRSALLLVGLVVVLLLGLLLWGDVDALIPILLVAAAPMALFVLGAYLVRARLAPHEENVIEE